MNTWYCTVPVATVWTSPESVRDIDEAGISNPVRLNEWLEKLFYKARLDLFDGNRVQTQLLYAEPVIVDKVVGNWAKIIAVWQSSEKDERGYPGWVPVAQLKKAEPIKAVGFAKVTAGKAQLWTTDGMPSLVVPFNTLLPYSSVMGEQVHVCTPETKGFLLTRDVELASSVHQFSEYPASVAVDIGLTFLDLPYFWGGMSPYGYDCSGFTFNMLKACGYSIPRDAGDQARGGQNVPLDHPEQWKKGDLLFFANDEGKVRHVGFYYGDGLLLHSPSTGKSIELVELAGSGLAKELCAVRRYGKMEGNAVPMRYR